MKLLNCYDQIAAMIKNTAGKYYKFSGMSFEDLEQELWLKLVKEDLSDIKMVKKTITNRAINICRDNKKYQSDTFCNFEDEVETFTLTSDYSLSDEISLRVDLQMYDEQYVRSVINTFDSDERIYLIIKGYLVGNLDFYEPEYNMILDRLGDKKFSYLSEPKGYYDDVIGKYFFNFSHVSMHKFKKNIMSKLRTAFA